MSKTQEKQEFNFIKTEIRRKIVDGTFYLGGGSTIQIKPDQHPTLVRICLFGHLLKADEVRKLARACNEIADVLEGK